MKCIKIYFLHGQLTHTSEKYLFLSNDYNTVFCCVTLNCSLVELLLQGAGTHYDVRNVIMRSCKALMAYSLFVNDLMDDMH